MSRFPSRKSRTFLPVFSWPRWQGSRVLATCSSRMLAALSTNWKPTATRRTPRSIQRAESELGCLKTISTALRVLMMNYLLLAISALTCTRNLSLWKYQLVSKLLVKNKRVLCTSSSLTWPQDTESLAFTTQKISKRSPLCPFAETTTRKFKLLKWAVRNIDAPKL